MLGSKPLIQLITVVGFISDHSLKSGSNDSLLVSDLCESYFMRASTLGPNGERKTRAVCNCHDLCALAPLGLPNFLAPFFAGANVPSM